MTVQELRDQLEFLDPNLQVKFSYNYGDYWRTQVAADILEVDYGTVEYSSYHGMDKISEEGEETVIILS
jgi:DNA-directed RNA polymerase specialized sigma24 family protein